MSSRTLRITLAVVVLLVVVGAATGWWWMAVGRYPLAGTLSHDFGEVPIAELTAGVKHTFRLHNRRDEPVVIKAVRPSCGCMGATASTRNVPPGGDVDVEVTLTLARAGRKQTSVGLVIEGFGVQTLWLEAVGLKERSLWINQTEVGVAPGQEIPLLVFAEIQSSDDPPGPLAFKAPEGIEASFVSWELATPRDAANARAAVWRGRVKVRMTADALPLGAVLVVEMDGAAPAFVPVVMRSSGAAPPRETPAGSAPDDR